MGQDLWVRVFMHSFAVGNDVGSATANADNALAAFKKAFPSRNPQDVPEKGRS